MGVLKGSPDHRAMNSYKEDMYDLMPPFPSATTALQNSGSPGTKTVSKAVAVGDNLGSKSYGQGNPYPGKTQKRKITSMDDLRKVRDNIKGK